MEFLLFLAFFAILFVAWTVIGHVFWIAIHSCLLAVGGKQCGRCGARYLAEHQCASKRLSLQSELDALQCLILRCHHSDLLQEDRLALLRSIKDEIRTAAIPERARQASRPSTTAVSPTQATVDSPVVARLVEESVSASPTSNTILDLPNKADSVPPPIVLAPTAAKPNEILHPLDQSDDIETDPATVATQLDSTKTAASEKQPAERRVEQRQIWTADVLQRFMQQSNIRWIELVSASLVVICSVGLVVSLWSTLSQASRIFPTLVFLTATLAVHGAGQYTLRQWNLRSTSRGILHIALMLIPLAVLVGILMATRRDGIQETADQIPISSLMAIGGGMLVYVALAVTACRALFHHRWRSVATTVISASLGLVAIGLLSGLPGLTGWLQWGAIGCTAVCGFAHALGTVDRLSTTIRWTEKKSRELAGSVIQILFATAVLLVFALTQIETMHGTRQSWWLTAGCVGLVWATVTSGLSLNLGAVSRAQVPGWLRVGTWILLLAASGLTLLSIRYIPTGQIELGSVIAVVGLWLAAYGIYASRTILAQLGVLATGLSVVLFAAACRGETAMTTNFAPWLAWQNVAFLSLTGLATLSLFLAPKRWLRRLSYSRKPSLFPHHPIDWPAQTKQLSLTGIGPLVLACGLTFIASFQGATWASHVLLIEGCLLIIVGIASCSDRMRDLIHFASGDVASAVVVIGQVLMLVGAIQLAETDTWLHNIINNLLAGQAPQLAWTAGVIPVAVAWAIAAVLARSLTFRYAFAVQHSKGLILSLACCAIVAVLTCAWAYTLKFGATPLPLAIGALVPLIALLNLLSCRDLIWRETLVLSTVLWSAWAGFASLTSYNSFPALGFACSSSAIVLSGLAGLIAIEAAIAAWRRGAQENKSFWNPIRCTESADRVTPALAVGVAWIATLLPLLITFVIVLLRAWDAQLALTHVGFYGGTFSLAGCSIILIALAALGMLSATATKWKWAAATQLRTLCGILPISCCVLLACSVQTEHAIVALLWSSASIAVALEFYSNRLAGQTEHTGASKNVVAWYDIALPTVLATLVLFTAAAFVHAEQTNASHHWSFVYLNIASAAITFCLGWLVAMRQGVDQARIAWCGGMLVSCVIMASFHIIDCPVVERILHSVTMGGLTLSALSLSAMFASPPGINTRAAATGFGQSALAIFIGRSGLGLVCILLAAVGKGEQLSNFHGGVLGGLLPIVGLILAGVCVYTVKPVAQGKKSVRRLPTLNSGLQLFVAASPLLVTVLAANLLNLDFSSQRGTLAPMHALAMLWIGVLAIDLLRQLLRFISGKESPKIQVVQWSGLAAVTSVMSVAMLFRWQSNLPTIELATLALLVLVSGKMQACWLRPHWASALATTALLPFFGAGAASLGPWSGSAWYTFCGLMWGPLAVIGCSLVLDRAYIGFSDANQKIPAGAITLERYSLIQIPLVLLPVSFLWLYSDLNINGSLAGYAIMCIGVSLTALFLSIARIWNATAKQRFWPVYLNTLAFSLLTTIAVSGLAELPAPPLMIWVFTLLSVMALVAQFARELIIRGRQWARPLRLAGTLDDTLRVERIAYWLTTIHLAAGLLTILPAFTWVIAQDIRPVRVAAALVPLLVAASVVPMVTTRSNALTRYLTLGMASTTLILCWWTFIPPLASHHSGGALWAYGQHTFAALIATAVGFFLAGSRMQHGKENSGGVQWAAPLYAASWLALVGGAAIGGIMMLGTQPNVAAAKFEAFTKLISVFAWAAISLRLLQFATRPALQDAWATITQRKTAVYAAQASLAFMCARLQACFPEFFAGLILPWWPIFALTLAMAAAMASTILHRRGTVVLADPLDNLALLLPLSPIIGLVFWTDPYGIWDSWIAYSILLIVVAGIYTAQSRDSRRGQELTVGLRLVSVAFLLASYWSFLLSNPSWRITEHPQFWLLPPALATLAYAQWSKSLLSKEALTATRYISLLVAYLSSSTEAFMSAFSGGLWQPAALIVLALAGIAAGIVTQVRSFVYCGAVFTFVALLAMVLQAQQAIGQVWPWWVFGIATGVSLIVALGYMEKNRQRVNQYIARVRGWNA